MLEYKKYQNNTEARKQFRFQMNMIKTFRK